MSGAHFGPTEAQAIALLNRKIDGPVVMLNLLRFREVADYSGTPGLAPATPINGADAFALNVAATRPHLEASGGEILFSGRGAEYFIGPEAARWDKVMLIRQISVARFLDWATHDGFLEGAGHRTAALADSRLLPIVEDALS